MRPVTSTACCSEDVLPSASRVLRSMAPLTAMFSASVSWRCQVVNTRSVMPLPATAASTDAVSRTSAYTCSTPGTSYFADRERPTTRNPLSCKALAEL